MASDESLIPKRLGEKVIPIKCSLGGRSLIAWRMDKRASHKNPWDLMEVVQTHSEGFSLQNRRLFVGTPSREIGIVSKNDIFDFHGIFEIKDIPPYFLIEFSRFGSLPSGNKEGWKEFYNIFSYWFKEHPFEIVFCAMTGLHVKFANRISKKTARIFTNVLENVDPAPLCSNSDHTFFSELTELQTLNLHFP